MLGAQAGVAGLGLPCPPPGVFGEDVPSLGVGGSSQGVDVGWTCGVDRGTHHSFGHVVVGCDAALDSVYEVVQDVDAIIGNRVKECRGGMPPPGRPCPGLSQRLTRDACVLRASQVMLMRGFQQRTVHGRGVTGAADVHGGGD
jgi:hypothetical protein